MTTGSDRPPTDDPEARTSWRRWGEDESPDARPRQRYGGPEQWDIDRAEDDDSGGKWLTRAGKWLGLVALIGLVVPMILTLTIPRGGGAPVQQVREPIAATVTGVIDGNTIRVDIAGRRELVRYIGVETPPPGDPFFQLGVDFNERWVVGQQVFLEADAVETDSEGRLLRYVWTEEGMVNAALIFNGIGRSTVDGGNGRYEAQFAELQGDAISNRRGIWGSNSSDA